MLHRPPTLSSSLCHSHLDPHLSTPTSLLLLSTLPFSLPGSLQPQPHSPEDTFSGWGNPPGRAQLGGGRGWAPQGCPSAPSLPPPSWELQWSLRRAPLLCASHPKSQPRSRQTGTQAPAAAGSSQRRFPPGPGSRQQPLPAENSLPPRTLARISPFLFL